jgi:hypothetical protein
MRSVSSPFWAGFLVTAALAGAAAAQEPDAATAAEMAAKMEEVLKVAAPGPAHAALAELAGEYTTTSRLIYGGKPAGPESQGRAKLSMALGGRFLLEENSGDMMGGVVNGWRILGYNNGSGRYEGISVWSMSTGLMSMTGSSPDSGKTIVLDASFKDEEGRHYPLKITLARRDADHFSFEVRGVDPDPAKNAVNTIDYVRVSR